MLSVLNPFRGLRYLVSTSRCVHRDIVAVLFSHDVEARRKSHETRAGVAYVSSRVFLKHFPCNLMLVHTLFSIIGLRRKLAGLAMSMWASESSHTTTLIV